MCMALLNPEVEVCAWHLPYDIVIFGLLLLRSLRSSPGTMLLLAEYIVLLNNQPMIVRTAMRHLSGRGMSSEMILVCISSHSIHCRYCHGGIC
jgi:hypothetical protein